MIESDMIKEMSLFAQIEGYATRSADPFIASFEEYYRITLVTELSSTLIQSLNNIVLNSAQVSSVFDQTTIPEIAEAKKKLDSAMENISQLNSAVDAVNNQSAILTIMLKQILSGEYYMGLAAIDDMEHQLPKLKEMAATIKTGTTVTPDDIAVIKDQITLYEDGLTRMKTALEQIDKKQILSVKRTTSAVIPQAYAGVSDYFWGAVNVMGKTANFAGSLVKKGASITYEGAKMAVNTTKTGIGLTLDTAGALVKTPLDLGAGLYYGNTWQEIHETQMQNFQTVSTNFIEGKSGADTLHFGIKTLDEVDNLAKQATAYLTSKTLNKTEAAADWISEYMTGEKMDENGTLKSVIKSSKAWTTWGTGQLAKLTSGFFTGFGKGIYKLANSQSTTADNVEGLLDVGLSLIGGSKALLKGSQFVSGGKELTKKYLAKGLTYVEKWEVNTDISKLSSLTTYLNSIAPNSRIIRLLTNTLDGGLSKLNTISEALTAKGQVIRESISNMWSAAPGKVFNTMFENATTGAKNSFVEFIKQGFERNLNGYLDAILTTTGKSFTDYFDNIVGSMADDGLKQFIRSWIEGNPVPGFVIYDGSYQGTWTFEGGSMPVQAMVKDGKLTGSAKYATSYPGISVSFQIALDGTVNEKGEVIGTLKGSGGFTGQIKGAIPSNGTFKGTIVDGKAILSYSITGSTFVCAMAGYGGGVFGGASSGTITMIKK